VEEAVSAPTLVRTPPATADWKKIPETMRSLWKACLPEQEGFDVARSLTINFFGVADAAGGDELKLAVERLQTRTPCRAFLLILDDKAQPGRAEMSATTRCNGNVRDIVLEEIVIRLPRGAIDQVPGLVRPLLMNDLPNHLYWAAPWPARAADFDDLMAMCDHAVIDSRFFRNLAADLAAVQQRQQAGKRITDLTWLRLRPWRRAIAEAFERVQWQPGTAVTGVVRHGRDDAASAHLLSQWLTERLGAKVTTENGNASSPSCLDGVALETPAFEIDLEVVRGQIRVHVSTPEHCYLPFTVPSSRGKDGDLLAAAIDQQ
jgi:hypothetical protein